MRTARLFAACLLSFFFQATLAMAGDDHLSLYTVTGVFSDQRTGIGVEMATVPGNRLALGAALETGPIANDNWYFRARVDARLPFSADLKTHWYPIGSVQWQLNENRLDGWLGVGFERTLLPVLDMTSDLLWQPQRSDLQVRFGLRLWLSRFDLLDARLRRAEPKGAVYQGGTPVSALNDVPVLETIPSAPPEPQLKSEVATAVITEVEKPPETVSSRSSAAPATRLFTPEPGWYVQLGLFRQSESVQRLLDDERLGVYRTNMLVWPDPAVDANRVLIGPYTKEQAQRVSQQLSKAAVENFLYHAQF